MARTRTSKFATTQEISLAASGRWFEILEQLCPDLRDAFKKIGRHVDCPLHGGKGDFRLCPKKGNETGLSYCSCGVRNGYQLIQELNDWSFLEAKDSVAEFVGLAPSTSSEERERKLAEAERKAEERRKALAISNAFIDKLKKETMNKMWGESLPLSHPEAHAARVYLASRKLNWELLTSHVRFHPRVEMPKDKKDRTRTTPAIVCRVWNNAGQPITLHCTHITELGAKIGGYGIPKHLLPMLSTSMPGEGMFIPIMKTSNVLGVAEGLETAIAASMLHDGMPVWPTISAGPLRNFLPPQGVDHLICFADLDENGTGYDAAVKLGENLAAAGWQGKYEIKLPPTNLLNNTEGDWADVLMNYQPQPLQIVS